jgi:atypical dual specificity phosphatase
MKSLDWLSARVIFYPTLAWNALLGRVLHVRNWWDPIDEHVVLGAFPFARDVPALADLGIRGVVNTCEEYDGPVQQYRQNGIEQFHMPTIDFTHPAYDDVYAALEFIQSHVDRNQKVYIHCKAGRGRSATVAICWVMKSQHLSAQAAQQYLLSKRGHINSRLTERPVVQKFESDFSSQKDQHRPAEG